jgi:hypothetical protein
MASMQALRQCIWHTLGIFHWSHNGMIVQSWISVSHHHLIAFIDYFYKWGHEQLGV